MYCKVKFAICMIFHTKITFELHYFTLCLGKGAEERGKKACQINFGLLKNLSKMSVVKLNCNIVLKGGGGEIAFGLFKKVDGIW